MTKKKASAQLKKARKLIEKGWARGIFFTKKADGTECYCSIGALNKTIMDDPWGNNISIIPVEDEELLHKCIEYLSWATKDIKIPLGDPYTRVVAFNDQARSTKNSVLGLYDKAIAKAQEDETKV